MTHQMCKTERQQDQADMAGTTCIELALEGERLCQTGDLESGIKFFEEAVKVGTNDNRTLSAIYSQLGNAYFHLENYTKALDYHRRDVTLMHSVGDEAAEAKACGNLGNTLKMLDKFDEAAIYCRRHLEISRKLGDYVGEARALYNLGNVYHMQGKRMIGTKEQDSGQLPNDIKASLLRAIEYYDANLVRVAKLRDKVAMGRAYGNLGNSHFLLGNFQAAADNHKKRLQSALETNDKAAERRAHLNIGNACVFLENFKEAIASYLSSLRLAQSLNDKETEAHSCYCLYMVYTWIQDNKSASFYHERYTDLTKNQSDDASLTLPIPAEFDKAAEVISRNVHRELSLSSVKSHRMSTRSSSSSNSVAATMKPVLSTNNIIQNVSTQPKLYKLSSQIQSVSSSETPGHDEKFLDEIMKYQSSRFDDQRSEAPKSKMATTMEARTSDSNLNKLNDKEREQADHFFKLLVKFQSDRIDDQRSAPPKKSINI